MITFFSLCKWPTWRTILFYIWVSSKPAHQTVISTEWHIPDVVMVQLILLMMGTWLPETCKRIEININETELSVKLVIYKDRVRCLRTCFTLNINGCELVHEQANHHTIFVDISLSKGRGRTKLLDDLKERRGYSHFKEEALDRAMWRARFGRDFGPVVRQTTKWMNTCQTCVF